MKKFSLLTAIAVIATFTACGGSSGSSSGGTGLNSAASVTGTVYSTSGDPLQGCTVYLPGTEVASNVSKATRSFEKAVTATDGTECEDPTSADSSQAAGCTAQNGTFTIDTSAVSSATQIVFQKGNWRMVQDLNCTADPCVLGSDVTTFGSGTTTWPNIAVVTGNYDRMEDVLAKLADSNTTDDTNGSYGRVDSSTGVFVYGSEYGTNMTIIDGTGYTTPTENTAEVTYVQWEDYLDGTEALVQNGSPVFDVIFINCGNAYESSLIANKANLQAYVNAGGRLYVTDLSYDYIEQPFPAFMQFQDDPADPDTPGTLNAAQDGTSGLTVDAVVNEASMSAWLGDLAVNRHNDTTPGNPDDDCGIAPYEQIDGALTSGGLIPLGDFLSGWAQMVGNHTGGTTTIWISSGDGVSFDGQDDRPLTASRNYDGGGQIVFSSYHTAHSCPTPTFWPQERVLQHLIFESF